MLHLYYVIVHITKWKPKLHFAELIPSFGHTHREIKFISTFVFVEYYVLLIFNNILFY